MIPGNSCDMNLRNKKIYTSSISTGTAADGLMCSQQSILSAMERFVKSVNNMDNTVLVPSRLRDMDLTGIKSRHVPSTLTNTELYNFYLMLNDVKKELLWGSSFSSMMTPASHEFVFNNGTLLNRSSSVTSGSQTSKHSPQLSSDDCLTSLASSLSSNASDTESDADSMITERDSITDDSTSHLFVTFRHHLQGLNAILHQLSESADYLSSRYQEEIEES